VWWVVIRRLLQAVVIVYLVATVVFFLIHLAPGDPFTGNEDPNISHALREQRRAAYGLDRPLPEQYVRYMGKLAKGDLGESIYLSRPVIHVMADAVPNTLLLMGTAILLSFAVGVGIGMIQIARKGSVTERLLTSGSLFFYSMPDFWLALVALLAFGYWLPIFPVGGMADPVMSIYFTPLERFIDVLWHLVLPTLTLTVLTAAGIARYQRSALMDVVNQDFIRTARAKGATERAVMTRHALRNAVLPVITLLGLSFPALLGGAVFVEKVFSWPGMGLVAVNALATRDYPLVVGCVLVGATMASLGSMFADLLYMVVDPRLRHST
jgi:peptide/nickel transport system permease protein